LFTLCLAGLVPAGWTAEKAAARHVLWKVERDGAELYLLGSVHFLKKEFYPLAEPVEKAFTEADVAVFEVDFKVMNQPETQVKVAQLGLCPPGKGLKDYLEEKSYTVVQEKLKGSGLPGLVFDRFQPWLAAVTLVTLEIQKLGFNPEEGVDRYFWTKAVKAGKKVDALETVEYQLSLFTQLTRQEQQQFLDQTLAELDQFKGEFEKITAAWVAGDVDQLAKLLLESMDDFPKIYERMLAGRNRAWVPKLEKFMSEKRKAFVVVGAAHLVGKDGVPELLRAKGYRVTQQ